jgi:hypothetical protein
MTADAIRSFDNYDPASRRRYARYPIDLRVDVAAFREGASVSFWGRSTELGEDGVGATITQTLVPGEVVWLEMSLPHELLPLKIRALVRYQDGLRHGFEFLGRTDEQKAALRRVCENLKAAL